jgi:hypothetical protein
MASPAPERAGSGAATTRVLFLNHSSLLICHGDEYILTDPFYAHPAFETWLPAPPMYVHPAYLVALARSARAFSILVSHGHDDHCDDKLLGLFKQCPAYVSAFDSPGTRNRMKRIGFETITELTEEPVSAGSFELSAYVHREFSLDDSIQLVNAPDLSVVHANDCWWPLLDEHRQALKTRLRPHALYASQVAIADGYPLAYSCFSDEEKRELAGRRVRKHIQSTLTNAADVGAGAFLHYAGHVKIFAENPAVNAGSGFVPLDFLRQNAPSAPEGRTAPEILDMAPGDTFVDGAVVPGLGRHIYDDEAIKSASVDFWNAYGEFRYKAPVPAATDEWLRHRLETFAREFHSYVEAAALGKGFRQDILQSRIIFHITGVASQEVAFSQFADPARIDLEVTWSPTVAGLILSGELNFEACYIGCLGSFSVTPKTHYNGHAVRWLNMFGYVWINRIVASLT